MVHTLRLQTHTTSACPRSVPVLSPITQKPVGLLLTCGLQPYTTQQRSGVVMMRVAEGFGVIALDADESWSSFERNVFRFKQSILSHWMQMAGINLLLKGLFLAANKDAWYFWLMFCGDDGSRLQSAGASFALIGFPSGHMVDFFISYGGGGVNRFCKNHPSNVENDRVKAILHNFIKALKLFLFSPNGKQPRWSTPTLNFHLNCWSCLFANSRSLFSCSMTGLKIAPPSLFLSVSVYISERGDFRPPSPASDP